MKPNRLLKKRKNESDPPTHTNQTRNSWSSLRGISCVLVDRGPGPFGRNYPGWVFQQPAKVPGFFNRRYATNDHCDPSYPALKDWAKFITTLRVGFSDWPAFEAKPQ
jgi:hypothetical protein